jgi:Zn-finger nucleic acid-binding protein
MPKVEPRYPCPVCLGSNMEKARVGDSQELELDFCRRCGGVWFELGEVQHLRRHGPDALWRHVSPHPSDSRTLCQACHAPIDRNAHDCPSCGSRNTIECPACLRPLEPQTYQDIRLDICKSCRGVWFDHAELAAIWKLSLDTTLSRRRDAGLLANPDSSGLIVLDALMYTPDVLFLGARAAGYAVSGTVEAVASSGVVEGVGEAAGSVFEVIVEIIGGLFS